MRLNERDDAYGDDEEEEILCHSSSDGENEVEIENVNVNDDDDDGDNLVLSSNKKEIGDVVVVGYALTSKKAKSFLQPKFEKLARNKGIYFVAIDPQKPLSEQGPFDIVLQKLSGKEWRQILESTCSFLS